MASQQQPQKSPPMPAQQQQQQQSTRKRTSGTTAAATTTGMDVWLQVKGRDLEAGVGQLRLKLIKGPAMIRHSADPVDSKAPKESFPAVLKFPVSTVTPDFKLPPWNGSSKSRLYQQDVPKPVEDSDDEEITERKKKWKYNRVHAAKRQWILQEQVDFLETMLQRREASKKLKQQPGAAGPAAVAAAAAAAAADLKEQQSNVISSRYEGVPEHTASHYVIFSLSTNSHGNSSNEALRSVAVRTLPTPETTIGFSQPAARRTMTLSEAEQAIQDQRAGIVSTVRGLPPPPPDAASSATSGNTAASGGNPQKAAQPVQKLRIPASKMNTTKSRLLQKLQKKMGAENDEEEGDDVMADVAYRSRKGGGGGGGAARRELLSTMGDGLTVSDDGVLGGGNDAAFGGRGQRFGTFQGSQQKNGAQATTAGTERGADGAAMADDFYTRDVSAEYEQLDYDANEQFDDDDVDLGESEVQAVGTDGYNDENGDDDDDDDGGDNGDDDAVSGAEGLATVAGFKALLAKARGEAVVAAAVTGSETKSNADEAAAATSANSTDPAAVGSGDTPGGGGGGNNNRSASPKPDKNNHSAKKKEVDETDHISKIMAAAEKSAQASKEKLKSNKPRPDAAAGAAGSLAAASEAASARQQQQQPAIQVDENGLRIITLEAVRRELWLNHGSIPIKRLIKIFSASKKHGQDRQSKFSEVVKELCTMTNDPVVGMTVVLKQHYSHMS